MLPLRVGHGFDVHAFSDVACPLYLGGIQVHTQLGVVAHSDGDVLLHALCDALLGAMGLGDIGRHFSDEDSHYQGCDSSFFVRECLHKLSRAGYQFGNADLTIVAQQPKLADKLDEMADNTARLLATERSAINIKATTTEKLGFVGRKEGIAVHAVVLIYKT